MTNIIKFETEEMITARFFRENQSGLDESVKKMQETINDPDKNDRTKLEARLAKAILSFDDTEFNKVSRLLERLNKSGFEIINGGKKP